MARPAYERRKASLAKRFHNKTKHWPWEITHHKFKHSVHLLTNLAWLVEENAHYCADFELLRAEVAEVVRNRIENENHITTFSLPIPQVRDIKLILERQRSRTHRSRVGDSLEWGSCKDNGTVTDDEAENDDNPDESVSEFVPSEGGNTPQRNSGTEAVQEHIRSTRAQSLTALPDIMATTELDFEPSRCHTHEGVVETKPFKQGGETLTQALGDSPQRMKASRAQNTTPYERVLPKGPLGSANRQPQTVQVELEGRLLQNAQNQVYRALRNLSDDVRKQLEKNNTALQQDETRLAALNKQLENSAEDRSQVIKSAETDLANSTIAAEELEISFRRLEDLFVPTNDTEKAFIDQRAADVASARQRRADAAVRLQEAKDLGPGGRDCTKSALAEQLPHLIASLEGRRERQQALAQEDEAVKLFRSVIRLGPAQLYHMLQLSQLAFPFDAAVQKYTKDFPMPPGRSK